MGCPAIFRPMASFRSKAALSALEVVIPWGLYHFPKVFKSLRRIQIAALSALGLQTLFKMKSFPVEVFCPRRIERIL